MDSIIDKSIVFLTDRKSRELCREIFGPENEVVFLVMNLTKSCQKERLAARHGEGESVQKLVDLMHKGSVSVLIALLVLITQKHLTTI